MLRRAIYDISGPVAIRYPRGGESGWTEDASALGSVCLREGTDITLVGYGTLIQNLLETADRLAEKGIKADVVKLNTITPLDISAVLDSVRKTDRIFVAEECIEMNCVGRRIVAALLDKGIKPRVCVLQNLGKDFVSHGSAAQLRKLCSLDVESLCAKAEEACGRG